MIPSSRRIASWLLLCLLAAAGPAGAGDVRLVVYHTNDIHGWIFPRPAESNKADPARVVGGAAVLARVLAREKSPRLLLDAGDWFQGTPEGLSTRGQAAVEVFNALGYDAVEVGNHDFDLGEKRLQELVAGLRMPALGANIYREKDGRRVAYLKPSILKEVGGVKVGIFGLLLSDMKTHSFPESISGLRFRREIDEAKEQVKALRARGAEVVIAVTHMGLENADIGHFEGDKALAASVPGIDLVVGGHSHTFLREPLRDPKNGTLIVQAGTTLSAVGRVELVVDPKARRVVSSAGSLVDLWVDEYGEDPVVAKLVRGLTAETDKAFSVVVATASAAMKRDFFAESALGDWVADCERSWGGTDAALMNGFGIRGNIAEGPVTLRRIFDIMPFDNRMVKITLSGSLLRRILDGRTARGTDLFQVSGLAFAYDRDKPKGERVTGLTVGGRPVSPDAAYTVATNDFVVRGGTNAHLFDGAGKLEFTMDLQRDVLRGCAQRQGLITPPPLGRMRSLEADHGS